MRATTTTRHLTLRHGWCVAAVSHTSGRGQTHATRHIFNEESNRTACGRRRTINMTVYLGYREARPLEFNGCTICKKRLASLTEQPND